MHIRLGALVAAGIACGPMCGAAAVDYFGPVPYVSANDTPADFFANGSAVIEDLEDGIVDERLSLPLADSELLAPGALTDSVDADDGVIDGLGTAGHSLFRGSPEFEVEFAPPLPTSAGLVWTDGAFNAHVTFEAFDADGASLGVFGPFTLGDGSNFGTTGEDRFFGARFAAGIRRLRIAHDAGGIEIDHIQFGRADAIFADGFDAPLEFRPGVANTLSGALSTRRVRRMSGLASDPSIDPIRSLSIARPPA